MARRGQGLRMSNRPRTGWAQGAAALALATVLAGCHAGGKPSTTTATPATSAPSGVAAEVQLPDGAVSVIARGLRIPWGVAFLPDGTALVTERGNKTEAAPGGDARIVSVAPGGRVTEIQRVDGVANYIGEGGLLGIVVSPHYATDRWVYIYYATETDNRVARLRLGQAPKPILTGIPVADDGGPRATALRAHHGGRLAFGPDGMLYVATGETYYTPRIAQDRRSLGGKILRITPEGKPAPGNPFPGSPVYSLGHRNVQGLAWDSAGRLYASELGLGTFDELNRIEPGHDYGWPTIEGPSTDPRFTNPIATWSPTSTCSPSGIAIRDDRIYVACLAGKRLYRVGLDGQPNEPMLVDRYGRLRAVTVAPDRSLWILTSNRDGPGVRGENGPVPSEDFVLRLVL
jgi:glucose/arabinose dehydrogenase